MKTDIVFVEDDPIVSESLKAIIDNQTDMQLAGAFGNAEDYLENLRKGRLADGHILLLDVGLPGMSGLEALESIRELHTGDIIMLTTYEEEDVILQALQKGASSYISKREGLKGILEGVRTVIEGGAYLSPSVAREIVNYFKLSSPRVELPSRQKEILTSLVDGLTYQSIAEKMNISVETVRSHIKKMYRNMHVSNKAEAIQMYFKGSVK